MSKHQKKRNYDTIIWGYCN